MSAARRRALALAAGVVCHLSFAGAVATMAWGIAGGMQLGVGRLSGGWALAADALLLAQFPLLHSWLLTRGGGRLLARVGPASTGGVLATTAFATIASWQVAATFLLWSPLGELVLRPDGAALWLHWGAFAAAWLVLLRALHEADLRLQTGALGWTALWRGRAPRFAPFPRRGLFARCRQPIYLGFALVLWTGPTWTLDRVLLGLSWGAYCVVGPRFKERRLLRRHGPEYADYRARVPYLLPRARA